MSLLVARTMFRWARLVFILTALFHLTLWLGFDWLGYYPILLTVLFVGVGTALPWPRFPLLWKYPPLHGWQLWSVRVAWLYAAYNFVQIAGGRWLGGPIPRDGLVGPGYFSGIMAAFVWIGACLREAIYLRALEAEVSATEA